MDQGTVVYFDDLERKRREAIKEEAKKADEVDETEDAEPEEAEEDEVDMQAEEAKEDEVNVQAVEDALIDRAHAKRHIAKQAEPSYEYRHKTSAADKLKASLDRTLLCFCAMKDQREDDFTEQEIEMVEDIAVNLLVRVFAKQLVDKDDKVTYTRATNYLNIYYELYTLKQLQTRREQFLDEFIDVIRLGEAEEFFQETSAEFVEPLGQFEKQLDAIVNVRKPKLALSDLVPHNVSYRREEALSDLVPRKKRSRK